MTIKKLNLQSNLDLCSELSNEIVSRVGWNNGSQIGLRSKPNSTNPWFESAGSLYDRDSKSFINYENNFSIWNIEPNNYLRTQIETLQEIENINIGRVRIMKLLPKQGLSVHRDTEVRYHLVLKTNPKAYFAFNNTIEIQQTDFTEMGIFYHIPADGYWYYVDTRKVHWVYNGGNEERIHIVVCGLQK